MTGGLHSHGSRPAGLPDWLTVTADGGVSADMRETTPAEADRRLVIVQMYRAGWRPAAVASPGVRAEDRAIEIVQNVLASCSPGKAHWRRRTAERIVARLRSERVSPAGEPRLPAEACDECVRLGQACVEHRPAGETDQRTTGAGDRNDPEEVQRSIERWNPLQAELRRVLGERDELQEALNDLDGYYRAQYAGGAKLTIEKLERERDEARGIADELRAERDRLRGEVEAANQGREYFKKLAESRAAGSEEENRG